MKISIPNLLYHGNDVIVEKPDIHAGKPRHDFGKGFYLTTDINQAAKWSKHKIKINSSKLKQNPYNILISKYVFDTNQFYSLRVKIFDHVSEDWLNYIIKNRKNIDFALNTDYDLVIGPVVDGANSWEALALYSNGTISFEKAISRLKPENLTDQWAFKTQNSINCLKYGGVLYEEK